MPNPVFPTLSAGSRPDTSKYSVSHENVATGSEMEGGYEFTRPKFTRAARKTWQVGYTMLYQAEKTQLETFWGTVKGGSLIFDWYNWEDGVTYAVRFADKDLAFQYTGVGGTKRWSLSFSVKQA